MIFFGSLTGLTAGVIGILQSDIKKIISYSTSTQLAYMFTMCWMSQYDLAFYHLINHSFFKALLFLTGGSLIYLYKNQDLRKITGLRMLSSFLYSALLIGTLASDGFFFFSSVESKDLILEIGQYSLVVTGQTMSWFGIISLFLTISYNSCLLAACEGIVEQRLLVPKLDLRVIISLTILMVFTLLSNYFLYQSFVTDFFSSSVFTSLTHSIKQNPEILPYFLKILIIALFAVLNTDCDFSSPDGSPDRLELIFVGTYVFFMFCGAAHVVAVIMG